MPKNSSGSIRDASTGGLTGEHAPVRQDPLLVAPSTADQFNRVRLPLLAVACWGIDDIRFAFDSSFVDSDCSDDAGTAEDIRVELGALADLVQKYPQSPLSLFGHADPVGNDVYNKALSERRARAIYALLIFKSDPETAVSYWRSIASTEKWGTSQRDRMQLFVGSSNHASADSLIRTYMEKLSLPGPALSKTDFLAQGSGADRKGDFQGCSEFNPLLIFSQEKQAEFDGAKQRNDQPALAQRNAENAPNRRVVGLLFRKGSRIDPEQWPCPRAAEGVQGCVRRFWADGEERRSRHDPGRPRLFAATGDTFACRFYQRISADSPCEGSQGRVTWITALPDSADGDPVVLLVRDGDNNEVARLSRSQGRPGPGTYYSFDLSRFDALLPLSLELHSGGQFLVPVAELAIDALRLARDLNNQQGAGASLRLGEPVADPSNPYDAPDLFDSSGEPCPVMAPAKDQADA